MHSDNPVPKEHCRIDLVIEGEEAKILLDIFTSVNGQGPRCKRLGHIENGKSYCQTGCPYFFRFGFDSYCTNQAHILKEKHRLKAQQPKES